MSGKKQLKCKRGHFFTDDNSYFLHDGTRKCKTCIRAYQLDRDAKNREKKNMLQRKWREENKHLFQEKYATKQRIRFLKKKVQVISHYSPNLKCICCGESEFKFLTIDHIKNDGFSHKKHNKNLKGGIPMYYWIIKNNFPAGFQVLCMNCNLGKHVNKGICPHKEQKQLIAITQDWQS